MAGGCAAAAQLDAGQSKAFGPTAPPDAVVAGRASGGNSGPAVVVVEALDVVFAEVVARLHLDDVKRLGARVLQPMPGALGDVGRLIRPQIDGVAIAHDL